MPPNDKILIRQGEQVRVRGYTATHKRLTLWVSSYGGDYPVVILTMCKVVSFHTGFVSAGMRVEKWSEGFIRISDGPLDVVCQYASRWEKEGDEQPSVQISYRDTDI